MSPAELAHLYDAHAAALVGHLRGILHSDADVRDVLQELFLKLATRPGLLDGVRDQRAFLLRMIHRAAIDHCRRQAARGKAHLQGSDASDEPTATFFAPSDDPDEAAFRTGLAAALAELPEEQRAVVQLKLWEQQTFQQIAALLEIPANTAASRYRYGLDKLRARLRPLYNEIR